MIDERAAFAAYTGAVVYDATNKQDSAYLGRFTFDTLLKGEGLQRILTILARGYLWQAGKPDIDRARDALRAWCSIPDSAALHPGYEGARREPCHNTRRQVIRRRSTRQVIRRRSG